MSITTLIELGEKQLSQRDKFIASVADKAWDNLAHILDQNTVLEIKEITKLQRPSIEEHGNSLHIRYDIPDQRTGKFSLCVEVDLIHSPQGTRIGNYNWYVEQNGEVGYFYDQNELAEYLALMVRYQESGKTGRIGLRQRSS